MSIALVRQAFEVHLLGMSPALPAVLENGHYTPAVGTPYQQAFLLPAAPDNPTLGEDYRREIGIFQVSLMYPQGVGAGAAQARALAVQSRFPRGLRLTAGGQTTLILRTPNIKPGRKDDDRWRIDIDIAFQAEVFG